MPSFDAGQTGITPGVTITRPDKTEYAARTTVGFTEVPAGSGSYDFAHPAPGTLLKFTFDALIGGVTYYASVWDDGLTTIPARAGDAMTLTAAYDAAKDAASQASVDAIDGKTDTILAEDVGADLGTDVCTITLRDASGSEVADARVYVSSDAAGLVRSDIRVTNALGQVAFDLTAGNTYYLWAFSTLVDFTAANPMSFVAAAD